MLIPHSTLCACQPMAMLTKAFSQANIDGNTFRLSFIVLLGYLNENLILLQKSRIFHSQNVTFYQSILDNCNVGKDKIQLPSWIISSVIQYYRCRV